MEMRDKKTRNPKKLSKNVSNIYRAARRCGIKDALSLNLKELYVRYNECKSHTKSLMIESPWMRKKFLTDMLSEAMDKDKTKEAKRIREIIKREAHSKEWQRIKRTTKPNQGGGITHVDVPVPGGPPLRLDKHEDMVEACGKDIMARSTKADSAPICQGALVDLLGYDADCETAVEILEGRFEPPDDMDGPTLLLFEQMGRI